MEPQPALNLLPTIQQAIGNLLTTHEPEFLRFGYSLFMSFATILLVLAGHPDDVLAATRSATSCSTSPSS